MIQARDLTKIFPSRGGGKENIGHSDDQKKGEIRAVDSISFECKPGGIFGLLGPNGAGKTTTLRLLSTILHPTSGTALINGADVVKNPLLARRQIGFLSSDTKLYGRLTPKEMVFYFGRLYGMKDNAIELRTEEIFRTFDMLDFQDRRNDRLSSGMQQKVSIARTIIHDPPVLVMDEPTFGLDIMASRVVVQFISKCKEDGKTVIISSHVMAVAEKLCDEIAILHRGKIMAAGSLNDLQVRTGKQDLEEIFIHLVKEENGGEDRL
jgi:sodium transport system ATP-binding protein